MNAACLLLVGFELANPGFELVNSLEQDFERLLVNGHGFAGLLRPEAGRAKSRPRGQEEQEGWPASREKPQRASMNRRSKDGEVHLLPPADQKPYGQSARLQSTVPCAK